MKYIKAPNGTCLKRDGDKDCRIYYRHAGNWYASLTTDDKMIVNSPFGDLLVTGITEATREEWLKSNEGYVVESKDEQIEDLKDIIEELKDEIPY